MISLEDIRRRSLKLSSRSRRESIFRVVVCLTVLVPLSEGLLQSQNPIRRIGLAMMVSAMAYVLFMLLQTLRRATSPPIDEGEVSVTYYRRALLAKRRLHNRSEWAVIPILLGMAVFLYPDAARLMRNPSLNSNIRAAIPFFIILLTWLVLFFYLKGRGGRWLQRELDSLDAFDERNPS